MISGGSLALAEGYSLNEEADIFNETSGAGGMVIEAGTDETGPIPATSFTIQSEQSGDGTGSYSAEVKGTYQPGGSGAVVYSVDIAWTDMNFTYTGAGEGTWDPETHQYEGGTEASWTDSNASVTVINHSNAAVTVTASFEALPGYETTSMTFGNNGATVATAVGTEVASAPPRHRGRPPGTFPPVIQIQAQPQGRQQKSQGVQPLVGQIRFRRHGPGPGCIRFVLRGRFPLSEMIFLHFR